MKKSVFVFLIAALMLFAACSAKENRPASPTEPAYTEAPLVSDPTAETVPTNAGGDEPSVAFTDEPAADPALIEAAWAIADKIGQVHEQRFDKSCANVRLLSYSAEVRFPSVTFPDEVLCVTVKTDEQGVQKAEAESVRFELAEGASPKPDEDTISEKLYEFRSAQIAVNVDDVRASDCEAEIGSDAYLQAAAAIYGNKLAEYYRSSLTEASPFCCYDIRFIGLEAEPDYADSYYVIIGFRVCDILPFSYLFGFGPMYEDGSHHPEYEGWLVGSTLVTVELRDDGCFVCSAILNSAG